jgi:sporulation protein YlmC with PRC-barrel domain
MKKTLFLSALAVALATTTVNAQNPAPGAPGVQPGTPSAAPVAHRAKQILGSKVLLQGNAGVGTVDDIVFDDNGSIEYLLVIDNGQYRTVPWQAAKWNTDQRSIVINVAPEQYKTVPTFTAQTYPNFYDTTYRTQVYKSYGLTPGQLRRIERREGVRP